MSLLPRSTGIKKYDQPVIYSDQVCAIIYGGEDFTSDDGYCVSKFQ